MNTAISQLVESAISGFKSNPSDHPITQYATASHVYLGHSDWMPMRALDILARPVTVDDFAICGLAGLNFIAPLSPARIVITDINPASVFFFFGVITLILACPTRADWVAALFGKDRSATMAFLHEPTPSDSDFFALPSSESEFLDWQTLFKSWNLPEDFINLHSALRNGKWTPNGWIPALPADQHRPIFLFKSDFNQVKNPHPVSHFFNQGWLNSEASYAATRSVLAKADIQLRQHNWMTESWAERLMSHRIPKSAAVYVSNIGSTIPLSAQKSDMFVDVIVPKIEASVLPPSAKELTRRLMIQFLQLNHLVNEVILHKNTQWICQFGRYDSAEIQSIIDTYS